MVRFRRPGTRIRRSLLGIVVGLCALQPSRGTAADPPSAFRLGRPVYYTFRPIIQVQTRHERGHIALVLPRPQEDVRQIPHTLFGFPSGLHLSERLAKDRVNRWMVVEADVRPGKATEVSYTAVIELRPLALDPAWQSPVDDPKRSAAERRETARYLVLTASTGKDHSELARAAKRITGDETAPLPAARKLYDAVIQRMHYSRDSDFKGAGRAWEDRQGQCCDYAAIFVALCRNRGIPARGVAGFRFGPRRWELHVWAEFYLHGAGWVPCDPTNGAGGPDAAEANFAQLDRAYLALTRDFDLEVDVFPPALRPQVDSTLVQQYLFQYQGEEPPTIDWQVEGDCLGSEIPKDFQRPSAKLRPVRKRGHS